MQKIIKIYITISLIIIMSIGCSSNCINYECNFKTDFSGKWFLNKNLNKKLLIKEMKNNSYYLKYKYDKLIWEGIGYQFGEKLLVIFNYKTLSDQGYVTFNYVSDTTISYKSFSTNGRFRADGIYYKTNDFTLN